MRGKMTYGIYMIKKLEQRVKKKVYIGRSYYENVN